MTPLPPSADVVRLASLLRKELTCDPTVCFSCLVSGVQRVIAERDQEWIADAVRRKDGRNDTLG